MDKNINFQVMFSIIILVLTSSCSNKEISNTTTIDLKKEQTNPISKKKKESNKALKYTSIGIIDAGKGAVFTNHETNELDASFMDGKTLNAGAISGVTNIKNPINAARAVMEKSNHVMLSGPLQWAKLLKHTSF